jgi:hypothetical protein
MTGCRLGLVAKGAHKSITLEKSKSEQRGNPEPKAAAILPLEPSSCNRNPRIILSVLLSAFVLLQFFLPLATAVKIGADKASAPEKSRRRQEKLITEK